MKADNCVVAKAIAYIKENPESRLSLDEIAGKMNYSKFHLSRLFAREVGCTIYKYIKTRRLAIAADKLTSTNKPIAEIALEANYDSQQAFSFAFRQEYGLPPQTYRNISPKNSFTGSMRMVA
ncbi:MAG: AraC family transcriptional regulator [Firmicutes bacterium]|nr:AraC family transcriptional regulator [Bacillota bacterium]